MKTKLTDTEQVFLDKFVDSEKIHPGNAAYWLFAKKLMEKVIDGHDTGSTLVTAKAYDLAQSILFNIVTGHVCFVG